MERRYPQLPPLPPHCPNPHCEHYLAPLEQSWFTPHGDYPTAAFGTVPRFRCRSCGKTFSTQTFSVDYYAKIKVDYKRLLMHLVTSSGVLDMSRFFHLRAETITNRLERLARIGLAVHSDLLKELPFGEDIAADGLESFTSSQFYPCHINSFVGSGSEFIYSLGFSPLRRKGRMTAEQRIRRAVLEQTGKAEPKAVENSFRTLTADMVQRIAEKGDGAHAGKRRLFTDEHPAYPRAFSKVRDLRRCSATRRSPPEPQGRPGEPAVSGELRGPAGAEGSLGSRAGDGAVCQVSQCDDGQGRSIPDVSQRDLPPESEKEPQGGLEDTCGSGRGEPAGGVGDPRAPLGQEAVLGFGEREQ